MGKKLQNICLIYYNLLTAQDLWQACHEILSIVFLKKNHRIKCKYRQDEKECGTCRMKYKYCDCFLEYANFKDDLIECKCSFITKTIKNDFLIHTDFLTTTRISFFILMNI